MAFRLYPILSKADLVKKKNLPHQTYQLAAAFACRTFSFTSLKE